MCHSQLNSLVISYVFTIWDKILTGKILAIGHEEKFDEYKILIDLLKNNAQANLLIENVAGM